mmetsp:Transcript_36299/g.54267  ORF Transcript_36299/g.54267 Transcript_36299/m.54267 type:complete len:86 (-) Transcript_36299:27-284(-)
MHLLPHMQAEEVSGSKTGWQRAQLESPCQPLSAYARSEAIVEEHGLKVFVSLRVPTCDLRRLAGTDFCPETAELFQWKKTWALSK